MKTLFELWVRGCGINDLILWKLEGSGGDGLYQTKKKYMQSNNCYYTSPVYHVWIGGEWIAATQSYQEAYAIWRERGERRTNE